MNPINFIAGLIHQVRAEFTRQMAWTLAGIAIPITLLAILSANTDPRFHSFCSQPSDGEILFFILALPLLVGTCIIGLGEGMLWSRYRGTAPRRARAHGRRAAILLGTAGCVAIAAGLAFTGLCGF